MVHNLQTPVYIISGLKIIFFPGSPIASYGHFLRVLCKESSTSLGSMQKFEEASGKFKGALGSWHPLILSPEKWQNFHI